MGAEPGFRASLRFPAFRWLWLADVQSRLGDQLSRVGISVLVFGETRSTFWTALAFAMSYLPALLSGLFLSVLADRLPRATLLVGADVVRALLILAVAMPGVGILLKCLLIGLASMISSLFSAAESATIPDLVPAEVFPVAVGLRAMTLQVAQLVGFAAGGAAVAVIGARPALVVDAVSFLISAAIISAKLELQPAAVRGPGDGGRGVLAGARAALGDPRLRVLVLMACSVSLYTVNAAIAAPYAHMLHGGSVATGLLLASSPGGTLIGVYVFTHSFSLAQRLRLMGPIGAAAGVPLLFSLLHPGLELALLLWFISGLLSAYYVAPMAQFTAQVAPEIRGRAIGFSASLLLTGEGVAMVLGGVMAKPLSLDGAIALGGALGCCVTLYLSWRWFKIG